ncbi:hypothetical protein QL285_013500 [Trifolium repens]|nr:hypothetical protein QL285_013500 [Trifolium repens]
MAPKKQKKVVGSSQRSQQFDDTKFKGPVQFERYQVLEKRKIWSERQFNIDPEGKFEKFAEIVDKYGWDKLINPPNKYNPSIVREFYANAYPADDEPFTFTTMVRGRPIRFDRNAIQDYLRTQFTMPANEELCDYQKNKARGNWDYAAIRDTLLSPDCDFEYSTTQAPLRAFRIEMTRFAQLLFLLILFNIQPNSHTSDAPMNTLGLIHYMYQGLRIDVAGIISLWMKEIVFSGHPNRALKSTKVKYNGPLGFPCLIMGLCVANRLTIPRLGNEEPPLINDEYVVRYCKIKPRTRNVPSSAGPSAPPLAAPVPNFGIFYDYMCNQNDANFRAMTAVHESITIFDNVIEVYIE